MSYVITRRVLRKSSMEMIRTLCAGTVGCHSETYVNEIKANCFGIVLMMSQFHAIRRENIMFLQRIIEKKIDNESAC